MSIRERRGLEPFELFDYLYLNGCDSFVDQSWFTDSIEFQYSRLVFSLVNFLLQKNKRRTIQTSSFNSYFDIINFILNKKLDDLPFNLNLDQLSKLGNDLELLRNVLNSDSFELEKFKSIIKLELGNKEYIIYSVCWIGIEFFKTNFAKNINSDFLFAINKYLKLAYIIDNITWDSIVSDYIFLLKENGFFKTDLINIEFNEELQSLFFILINPYNICPSLCSLFLLLKGKVENFQMELLENNLITKNIIENLLLLFSQTLKNISPDLAELSFTITVSRLLASISRDICSEFIFKLQDLKFSYSTKEFNSMPIIPSFLDRFILNCFSTMEQFWCEISKDELFLQSILTNIPSYELSVTILSFRTSNKKLARSILLLLIFFSINYGLSVTGEVNKNTFKIFKDIVSEEEYISKIIKFFLFFDEDNHNENIKSSLKLKWILSLFYNNVSNSNVSINIIKSMVSLIQLNDILTLSEDFLYKFLESFPNLIKLYASGSVKNFFKIFNMNLLDLIDCYECLLISDLFWCNSNLIQVILNNVSIEFEHIFTFVHSLSLSISLIQKKIDEYESNNFFSFHEVILTNNTGLNLKLNNTKLVNQVHVKKLIFFIIRTKNLDNIVIAILDFLSDWLKKNEKTFSLEQMLEKINNHDIKISEEKLEENWYRYTSIFMLYLYSKSLETDKLDKYEIIEQLHNIPWKGSLKWIISWDKIFSYSILNSRFWQTVFSEKMAILIPESFIIPTIPNLSNELIYFTLDNISLLKLKLSEWLSKRRKLIDSFDIVKQSLDDKDIFEIKESTSEWLGLFYLEPNMTLYLSIELLFLQDESLKNDNFSKFYFDMCLYENKLKEFIKFPENYFKESSKYLFGRYSLEILCNISLAILYIHEVIKHRRSLNTHSQNIDYEVFCIIWNKIVKYNGINNKFVNKQFSIFVTNITNRNAMVIQQIIENGLQYKYENDSIDINTYLKEVQPLVAMFCQNTSQLLKEHTILPKIANKLDKLLNTKLVCEYWTRYSVIKKDNRYKEDFEIENQIISCVLLLLWLCNIIVEPSSVNCNFTEGSNENITFLPVAERSIVRVLCISQEIISSNFEEKLYNNLLSNLTVFLTFSIPFITSISNSFPQLTNALKDIIGSLKKLTNEHCLTNSEIHQIIISIDQLL